MSASIFADPAIFADAPCTRQDTDLAFDAPEVMATICNTECPAATTWACLKWAIETDTLAGVFGGLTGEQRRELVRATSKPAKPRREVRADQHGTRTGYNYGCRCVECREAHNAHNRALRARRRAEGVPAGIEHGTANAYTNYGCRCDECRAANTARWHAQKGGDA